MTILDRSLKGNDKMAYENVTSLAQLIFQFSYLRMHMEDETFLKVIACTSNILNKYRKTRIRDIYQNEIVQNKHHSSEEVNDRLFNLSAGLSEDLFSISAILNSDLYPTKQQSESDNKIENEIRRLLNSCGLKEKNQS